MSEAERINDQLQRAFVRNAWHGASVRELLEDLTGEKAARRPIEGAHTIWEIVLHMTAWQAVVRRRIEGERITQLPPEQDWPPIAIPSEAAWRTTLEEFEQSYRQLRDAIARLSDTQLNERVAGKEYSVYVMLHGIIQHDLYHAGQIALLKKALA